MINKIIHYCWFGGNKLNEFSLKCIQSWKEKCPDYQIVEWNEKNFDIDSMPLYVRQAYDSKKWAFVTDYVRLYLVYTYGGIYLDTDVELLRSLDSLLDNTAFFGIESGTDIINTGVGFGAIAKLEILKKLMDDYNNMSFSYNKNGKEMTPCTEINAHVFNSFGYNGKDECQNLNENMGIVLSSEFMCPKNWKTGEIKITNNTISIHHFDASWFNKKDKLKIKIKYFIREHFKSVGNKK